MNIERKTISVEQAGRILGVSRITAFRLAREGTIPTIRVGVRKKVVPMAAFEKMLANAGTSGA